MAALGRPQPLPLPSSPPGCDPAWGRLGPWEGGPEQGTPGLSAGCCRPHLGEGERAGLRIRINTEGQEEDPVPPAPGAARTARHQTRFQSRCVPQPRSPASPPSQARELGGPFLAVLRSGSFCSPCSRRGGGGSAAPLVLGERSRLGRSPARAWHGRCPSIRAPRCPCVLQRRCPGLRCLPCSCSTGTQLSHGL